MPISNDALLARVRGLLEKVRPADASHVNWDVVGPEIINGTQSLMEIVYGPNSGRIETFLEAARTVRDSTDRRMSFRLHDAARVAEGILHTLEAEIEAGLVGDLERQVAGGILGDFIQLGRAALDQGGEGSKNVAAVLAAAAYEDTIRRMGREFAGVIGQDDLEKVIGALKHAGVLVGSQVSIASSFLTFRNHALHAHWDKVERESVQSVLGFVQELLMKHFGP